MHLPEVKLKLDHAQMACIGKQLDLLLNELLEFGKRKSERVYLSILMDVERKFRIEKFARPKKHYTKRLKYHEAEALFLFLHNVIDIQQDVYSRTCMMQVLHLIDKQIF